MNKESRYYQLSHPSGKMPDRQEELWRFGRPQTHANAVAKILAEHSSAGEIFCNAPAAYQTAMDEAQRISMIRSTGSHALIEQHAKQPAAGLRLHLTESLEEEIHIHCQTQQLLCVGIDIILEAGVKASIVEEHRSHGEALLFALRRITLKEGAELRIELRETGSGKSRAFNITECNLYSAKLVHITRHEEHIWAREESSVNLEKQEGSTEASSAKLLSANYLRGVQMLDQRTDQNHMVAAAQSELLYKNVMDDRAQAVFNGSIHVAEGAHQTEAYQTNRNLMLSEQCSIHSLPGLEILADDVKCSHGSASGPMDEEQLFFMMSRGLSRDVATRLVAEGFLQIEA